MNIINAKDRLVIIFSGIIGIIFVCLLVPFQNNDNFVIFMAAPYFFDKITLDSGMLVGPITFIYYIIFFVVLGIFLVSEFFISHRKIFILCGVVILHCVITFFGGRMLGNDIMEGIDNGVSLIMSQKDLRSDLI